MNVCKQPEKLDFSGTKIDSLSLFQLGCCPSLKVLNVTGTDVKLEGFWYLAVGRLERRIKTPLIIKIGVQSDVRISQLLEELELILKNVNVRLSFS